MSTADIRSEHVLFEQQFIKKLVIPGKFRLVCRGSFLSPGQAPYAKAGAAFLIRQSSDGPLSNDTD
ncbi:MULTISPECIES: hypothetical protein [unclassified Caballeronia]|uniref:hypothetical protein n=1 Tax=unclassified Caballeronia TaxID=2646786 RepID=UPI0013EBD658|nr:MULTISPECIES: hypothetical protein [unclassified Caballeronia]